MSVTTKVKLLVEVKTDSSWGDDCTVGQVKRQSLVSALKIVNKVIQTEPNIRICSHPECVSIIHVEEEHEKGKLS